MFALFRFDLPIAVTKQLIAQLDKMESSPLSEAELQKLADYQNELARIQNLPQLRQGVYVIFLGDKAVYAGKADNLRGRLGDHKFKVSGRRNIDLDTVRFKCLILEASWSTSANESLLIEHYQSNGQCEWNLNGFGTNDPGKNRDGSIPNAFDTNFPINEDCRVEGVNDQETVGVLLAKLKAQLPFLLRFELNADAEKIKLNLKGVPRVAKSVLIKATEGLGKDWQLMMFKGYITLYRNNRRYEHGKQLYP